MPPFPSVVAVDDGLGNLARKLGKEAARYSKAEIDGYKTELYQLQWRTARLTHVFVNCMEVMENVVLARTLTGGKLINKTAWPAGTTVVVPANSKLLGKITEAAKVANLQVQQVSRWHEPILQPGKLIPNGREPAAGEMDGSIPWFFDEKKPTADAAGEGSSSTATTTAAATNKQD